MSYELYGTVLPDVKLIVDLGVTIDSNLNFKQHIKNITIKAHQRACLIVRCFKSRDPTLLFRAFCVYVRPLLEYCEPVWSPCYLTYIVMIEAVQRRFTKRLLNFRHLSYEDRLHKQNVDSLELRRLKLNLTTMYKILHGGMELDINSLFSLSNAFMRGHNFKLVKPSVTPNSFKFSFACRTVDCWNVWPNDVVSASSIAIFKKFA